MKTITAKDATIRLAEMVEPRPTEDPSEHAKHQLADYMRRIQIGPWEWWPDYAATGPGKWNVCLAKFDPLHSLDDAVRVAEAIKALWLRSVVSGGDRWFVVTEESEGESIYTDNRHAWHLCEAILSAVDGEQTTIVED